MNYSIIALVSIAILFLWLWIINRLRFRKLEIKRSKKYFRQIIRRRKIENLEEKLILDLLKISSVEHISDILTNRNVFNKAVEEYITKKLSKMPATQTKSILDRIRVIRIKNSFHRPLSFRSLTTTKEIEPKINISIEVEGKMFKSTILNSDEKYLSIPLTSAATSINFSVNKSVFLGFFAKNDGHYRIKMNVAKILNSPPVVYLEHTASFTPPKKRVYSRVRTSIKTLFELVSKDNSESIESKKKQFKGIITNISAGGAEVRTKRKIPTGIFLLFEVALESGETVKELKAVVIRKVTKTGYFIYNIQYVGISDKKYKTILKFVNLKIKEKR